VTLEKVEQAVSTVWRVESVEYHRIVESPMPFFCATAILLSAYAALRWSAHEIRCTDADTVVDILRPALRRSCACIRTLRSHRIAALSPESCDSLLLGASWFP